MRTFNVPTASATLPRASTSRISLLPPSPGPALFVRCPGTLTRSSTFCAGFPRVARVLNFRGEAGGARAGEGLSDRAQVTKERQQLFDEITPVYDLLNDVLSIGLHRVWKRMTVSWSGAEQGDTALDICCGSGDIALLLSEKVGPRGKVVGLDFAKEQLSLAESKEKGTFRFFCSPIDWVLGDALALPFESGSFDAVTMGYGLRNVADVSLALREIHRVLKPGKSCAILDFNNSEDESVASFQSFMLKNAVVPVATQFGLAEQYEYLEPSIRRFPHGRALESTARAVGFVQSVYYEVAFGLMGVLVAKK